MHPTLRKLALALAVVPALVVPLALSPVVQAIEPSAIGAGEDATGPAPSDLAAAPPAEAAAEEPLPAADGSLPEPAADPSLPEPAADPAPSSDGPPTGVDTGSQSIDAGEPTEAPATDPALASGAIAPGETVDYAFAVDLATHVRATVVSDPGVHVYLIAPWGGTWSDQSASARKELQFDASSTPSTGTWRLRLVNTTSAPVVASYETSFRQAGVDLGLFSSVGKPYVSLGVNPTIGGVPQAGLSLFARITSPSGEVSQLPMQPYVAGSTGYWVQFDDLTPGLYIARVWFVVGSTEHSASMTVRVADLEDVPPTVQVTTVPAASNASGWFARAVTATLTSSDGGSGPWQIYYQLNGGATVERFGSVITVPIPADGDNELRYWATDAQGNTSTPQTRVIRIDTVAPSATISTPVNGGEYAVGQEVDVEFLCADDRSGVRDCIGTVPSGEPLDTSTPGEFEFTVTAVDRAGNVTKQTHHYRVGDTTIPTVTASIPAAGPSGWHSEPVAVVFAASDDTQVDRILWRIDGVEHSATDASATHTISDSGEHRIQFWALDAAGNSSAVHEVTVRVDLDAPGITIESPTSASTALVALEPGQYAQGSAVAVDFTCSDLHSGVASCEASTDDGEPLPTGTAGFHTFTVSATDAAGNTSSRSIRYEVVAAVAGQPAAPKAALASTGSSAPALEALVGLAAMLVFGLGATIVSYRRPPARR